MLLPFCSLLPLLPSFPPSSSDYKICSLKPHATANYILFSRIQTAKYKLWSSWPQGRKVDVSKKKLKWIYIPISLLLKRQRFSGCFPFSLCFIVNYVIKKHSAPEYLEHLPGIHPLRLVSVSPTSFQSVRFKL